MTSALPVAAAGARCVDPAFNTDCGTDGSGNVGCTVNGPEGTQECSCTVPAAYWSGTPVSAHPGTVWWVDFGNTAVIGYPVSHDYLGRAVRGGAAPSSRGNGPGGGG